MPRKSNVEVQHSAQKKMSQASLDALPPNKALERTFHSGLSCAGGLFSSQESPLRSAG